jgi:type VI secretion system secreted protein Hcp
MIMALVDYFLKIDGVEGESQDAKHKGEIQILSFNFGESQAGSMADNGGGGCGKVQMQDFHFTMNVNKASPKLFLTCATGEHLPTAVLTCRKAGADQHDYLKVTLSHVLVSSYQTSGDTHGGLPLESISLNFAAIEVEYRPQHADGRLAAASKVKYNLKQMTSN